MYLVDKYVVGGFYRIHSEKGLDENLNTPGMQFSRLHLKTAVNSLLHLVILIQLQTVYIFMGS